MLLIDDHRLFTDVLAFSLDARADLREEFHRSEDPARRHQILEEALTYVNRQLELVRKRKAELETLETELANKRRRIRSRLSTD